MILLVPIYLYMQCIDHQFMVPEDPEEIPQIMASITTAHMETAHFDHKVNKKSYDTFQEATQFIRKILQYSIF